MARATAHCGQRTALTAVYRLWPSWVPRFCGGIRCVWKAPEWDCHSFLGVSKSASSSEIRKAYIEKAKVMHPDASGKGTHEMAQLNLSYEALTEKRDEYDAAVGNRATPRTASHSYTAGPWWRERPREDFDFDEATGWPDWEDLFQRYDKKNRPYDDPSWQERAEFWRQEEEEDTRRHPRWRARRTRRPRHHLHESDSEDDEFDERPRHRPIRKHPGELWLEVSGRWNTKSWDGLTGNYTRLKDDFNERPCYVQTGGRSLHLFWSDEFRDWKLADQLEDDGMCLAFMEDLSGNRFPWFMRKPRWSLWEPSSRRFVMRRLCIEACEVEHDEQEKESQENHPWPNGAPSLDWTTLELLNWADYHKVSLHGCFDPESVLERVLVADMHLKSSSSKTKPKDEKEKSNNDDSDKGSRARQRKGDGSVRLASRMKTDGSYTKPPKLDKTKTKFGNRVERFRGKERSITSWLRRYGDRSRLYGVFIDGAYIYSLVWKRQKYWGRPRYPQRSKRTFR